ncbi:methyltransferase [Steroidobacter agaridevorans]|uniref:Methyltransferase n=1 Tax=Steroidobacter agaridevorans TaxID=2695856 RepID=A0A829YKW0_9GAMM|nr:class I SAM-dependent methyltransferase [Steroidobacter agaridevorans]GFE83398.1 methyltransferase [Steroidobacter agaridevorans]GFE86704.1 methyltransferase [Steroidobacter agaridevorans]
MALPKRAIAASFLPDRYRYWYSLSKLAMDPLYEAMPGAFDDEREPLLDLGCGIGLLLHCLRAGGCNLPYVGVDTDAMKIDAARDASARGGITDANFQVCDLSVQFPKHHGSVALLDVLQYLPQQAQGTLLAQAAQCVSKQGKLVIRTGLADGTWRSAMTRATDRFGHLVGWMKTSFKAQPSAQELRAVLQRHGLQAEFKPLWGRTPFNNWLVIARRSASAAA